MQNVHVLSGRYEVRNLSEQLLILVPHILSIFNTHTRSQVDLSIPHWEERLAAEVRELREEKDRALELVQVICLSRRFQFKHLVLNLVRLMAKSLRYNTLSWSNL